MFRWLKCLWSVPAPTPCPYCPNPDRDTIYESWHGCEWKMGKDGGDPPCVCDGYGSNRQLGKLGMGR